MFHFAIDARCECPRCGAPVFVRALVPRTTCAGCQALVDLSPVLSQLGACWGAMLDRAGRRARGKGAPPIQHDSEDGRMRLRLEAAEPTCARCSGSLSLPEAFAAGSSCPSCQASVHVRAAPREGALELPAWVTHLVGEDPHELPGPAAGAATPSSVTGRPVSFACPACNASLSVDGSSRTVECSYCRTSAFLPDDLWQRLRPASTARRWYLRCNDTGLSAYLRAEQRSVVWVIMAFVAVFVAAIGVPVYSGLLPEGSPLWLWPLGGAVVAFFLAVLMILFEMRMQRRAMPYPER